MDIATFEVGHTLHSEPTTSGLTCSSRTCSGGRVLVDVAPFEVGHPTRFDIESTTVIVISVSYESTRNIQPNQLGRPAILDKKDASPTFSIKHHATRHLGFNGHVAVDADCRLGAHVAGELVGAWRQ